MLERVWRFLALLAACGSPVAEPREPPAATPSEGLAIAIYNNGERSYGVVDDRRTIDVTGDTVYLDRIDPAAALQSLVIEPLNEPDGGDPIRVLSCVRERVDGSPAALAQLAAARNARARRATVVDDASEPERVRFEALETLGRDILLDPSVLSPLVRCRVAARAGKHLVRVLHVTTTLTFRTQHDLTMTSVDRVRVATRFAIHTPSWRARARVTLFEGVPGDQTPPRALAAGPIILDGSTAILAAAPRELPATLRTVYSGIKLDDSTDLKPADIVWGRESRRQVWVWVEVATPDLAAGPVRAHIELPDQPVRDVDIAAELAEHTADRTRVPLWIDEDLLGSRTRTIERADGVLLTERIQLAVANLGTQPREVWIEERLRTAKRRTLVRSWPVQPTVTTDVARTKLAIAPGQTARFGFTVDYEP